jgi:outer membrane protein insertion porin family/translocation and assembly module TamA
VSLALVLLALPRLLSGQEVPVPSEPERGPEVVALDFEGRHALTESQLEGAIVTRATSCKSPLYFLFCAIGAGWAQERAYLDPAQLTEDEERLRLLYEAWGYPDAEVGVRVVPRGDDRVAVVFTIVEGEPLRVASLEVRGLESLTPPVRLAQPLPLRSGDVYALPLLAELERRIRLAFAERGHPYAQVEVAGSVDEATRTAALVLTVTPGPVVVFGPAAIVPERPIEESTVRERLAFKPGDLFRPSSLEATERALYQLPIVERVVIEPIGLERGDTVITPRIEVAPRKQRAFQVEGTISSTECLELAVFAADRYFLGGPRLFGLGVGFSNLLANTLAENFPCTSTGTGAYANPNYFVEAELRQPWPGTPKTSILARGFYSRESTPQVYIQRGYGGQLGIAREFRPDLVGSLLYSPARNELRAADVYYCGNYAICDEAVIDTLTDLHWTAPVDLLLSWTPGGPPLTSRPVAGENWRRWIRAGLAGAASFTGSQYDYVRSVGEGAVTRFYGDRFELAYRTRLGLVAGQRILPPQTRLYSGGVNTVRGVAQNLLGPKILLTKVDDLAELGCVLETGGCPPGLVVDPDLVSVRALGGRAVTEANVEGRVWIGGRFQLVGFVDFGSIWRDVFRDDVTLGGPTSQALITPGIGVRILTGMGPIRLDVGYDPSGTQRYPLLVRDPLTDELVFLGDVSFNPFTFDHPSGLTEFWRRLQLQVAIGQPF